MCLCDYCIIGYIYIFIGRKGVYIKSVIIERTLHVLINTEFLYFIVSQVNDSRHLPSNIKYTQISLNFDKLIITNYLHEKPLLAPSLIVFFFIIKATLRGSCIAYRNSIIIINKSRCARLIKCF